MSRFLCCWLLTVSLAQLTTQLDLGHLPPPYAIEFTIITHRNESGQYVTEWKLKDSKDPLPEDAKLHVKTSVSESEGKRTLILHGVYSDSLRQYANSDPRTAVKESAGETTIKPQKITTVPATGVPEDYEYFPGVGYYKFYPVAETSYNESMKTCSNDGAHLAIVNSEEEMKVLTKIFARQPDVFHYAYLGFRYQRDEGKFVTIFG